MDLPYNIPCCGLVSTCKKKTLFSIALKKVFLQTEKNTCTSCVSFRIQSTSQCKLEKSIVVQEPIQNLCMDKVYKVWYEIENNFIVVQCKEFRNHSATDKNNMNVKEKSVLLIIQ